MTATLEATETEAQMLSRYLACGLLTCAEAVGSRVTCNPPPSGTDEDYLCLTPHLRMFVKVAEFDGWDLDGSELRDSQSKDNGDMQFQSLKKGDMNLIVTASGDFFKRFLAASSVAKRFNLMAKAERVALFQAVLYGNECDGAADALVPILPAYEA